MNDSPVLKTPGEMIGDAREAQGLSVAQLSERTKIPPPVLSALELDEYHKISGPLYIKSFLRTCAVDLGLDPDAVLGLYNKISGEKKSGSPGAETVWGEDEVKVSRIGLPWPRIIMYAGIAAVVIGFGLFALRGCGDEAPADGGDSDVPVQRLSPEESVAAGVGADSASGSAARQESMMSAAMEAELLEKAAVDAEAGPAPTGDEEAVVEQRDEPRPAVQSIRLETGPGLPDSLDLGWMLSNPPPVVEKEIPVDQVPEDQVPEDQVPEDQVMDDPVMDDPVMDDPEIDDQTTDDQMEGMPAAAESVARDDPGSVVPLETPAETRADTPAATSSGTAEEPGDRTLDDPGQTPGAAAPDEIAITGTEPAEDSPQDPVVISPGNGPDTRAGEGSGDLVDSAWPLVLRVSCESPQRIQVKRDSDRDFSEVRWPTADEPAPQVPAAGFEAGRAYRQGDRLVVFWGANDHFSLILAHLRGVEVAVNGRVRANARLRAGQEIVLDKAAAGLGAED